VLTNGTGLVFMPAAATDMHDNVRTVPALTLNLSSIIQNLKPGTPVRAWLYNSAQNIAANGDQCVLSIENWTKQSAYIQKRNFFSGALGPLTILDLAGSNAGDVTFASTPIFNDNVMVTECDSGVCGGSALHYGGVYSSGWPVEAGMDAISLATAAGASVDVHASLGQAGQWDVLFGAGRAGSATSLSVTIARLKVEFKF
jgi:hypothetical protein